MIRNVLNQFECKIGKAGEILCNTDDTGNVLLFVSSGKLVIYNRNQCRLPMWTRGILYYCLPKNHLLRQPSHRHGSYSCMPGPLSEMITDDPEWDPDRPVILPICPSLAKTLYLIEYYQNEKRSELN